MKTSANHGDDRHQADDSKQCRSAGEGQALLQAQEPTQLFKNGWIACSLAATSP
jgi:hypothetical protein